MFQVDNLKKSSDLNKTISGMNNAIEAINMNFDELKTGANDTNSSLLATKDSLSKSISQVEGLMSGSSIASKLSAQTITGATISGGTISGSYLTGVTGQLSGDLIVGGTIDGTKVNVTGITVSEIKEGTTKFIASSNGISLSVNINGTETAVFSITTDGSRVYTDIQGSKIITSTTLEPISSSSTVTCTKIYQTGYDTNTGYSANARVTTDGRIIKAADASSQRFKRDIKEVCSEELDPHKLYDLEVKQFKFIDDFQSEDDHNKGKDLIGFIAEEVNEIYPVATFFDEDGKVENWNIRYIVPPMLKLIQEQKQEIDELRERLNKLEKGLG